MYFYVLGLNKSAILRLWKKQVNNNLLYNKGWKSLRWGFHPFKFFSKLEKVIIHFTSKVFINYILNWTLKSVDIWMVLIYYILRLPTPIRCVEPWKFNISANKEWHKPTQFGIMELTETIVQRRFMPCPV